MNGCQFHREKTFMKSGITLLQQQCSLTGQSCRYGFEKGELIHLECERRAWAMGYIYRNEMSV